MTDVDTDALDGYEEEQPSRRIPPWVIIVVFVVALIVGAFIFWRLFAPGGSAGEQAIIIENPQDGAAVSTPLVISGRTTRYPSGGRLHYRVTSANNVEIGTGDIAVLGQPGAPTTFNSGIDFRVEEAGERITVEFAERSTETNEVIASTSVNLSLGAPATPVPDTQAITIDTPAPGTQVNSPVVITGRTNQYPSDGNLSYRVVSDSGNELGNGEITVTGAPGQPATFNASIGFTPPPAGGTITIELVDRNADGSVNASNAINLTFATAPPPTAVPPTPVPSPTAPPPPPTDLPVPTAVPVPTDLPVPTAVPAPTEAPPAAPSPEPGT
jgi:hypothetical protein